MVVANKIHPLTCIGVVVNNIVFALINHLKS